MDGIVLAAGKASRLGVPKFLLPAGSGHTLLTRVLEAALSVCQGRVVLVLGREAKLAHKNAAEWLLAQSKGNLGTRVLTVTNQAFEQGQSTSLIAGIRASQGSQGVLVFLADMPLLSREKLEQLRQAIESSDRLAVSTAENGQVRPPVYLSSELFSELQTLKGDQGARAILSQHPDCVERVEWGFGPWFTDIDDWETYRQVALEQGWENETFEPLEKPPKLDELSSWFTKHRLEPDAPNLLRRAVLTLLSSRR